MEIKYSKPSVKLINKMEITNDSIPAKTARVSYDNYNLEKSFIDDLNLNSFLLWKGHTTPFEKLVFTFEIECSLFVRSQIMRTRTASYNEISRRYTAKDITFMKNIDFRHENKNNLFMIKTMNEFENEWKKDILPVIIKYYNRLINAKVSNEVARQFLPQNMMTKFHMKIDLHNLFRFLEQRLNEHAQKETRDIAFLILNLLKKEVPQLVQMWTIYRNMKEKFMDEFYDEFKLRVKENFVNN
jgi:thymidylate synthase (FAD)